MKKPLSFFIAGLSVIAPWGVTPGEAVAETVQLLSYWDLVQQQDPYFNTSGSMLPQRYTTHTPTPQPSQQPRTQTTMAPLPFTPYTPTPHTPRALDAQNASKVASGDLISELRLGVLSHDIQFPSRHGLDTPNPFENRYESGININPEIVFTSPDWLDWFWAPRPHLGISVSTSGDTSSIYTGLGWDTSWDNGVFLDGFFGLAAHDGELRDGNPKGKIEFGSRALFRLGGEVGWRWDDHNGVALLWEHMSNGSILSSKNQGIDSLGLRYSYRFDKPD